MKKRLSRTVLLLLAGLGLCLPASVRAGAVEETADRIAAEIARDSGRPASDYSAYARRLAKTLTNLSPEVLERVLKEHASAVTGGSTTDPGGTGTPPPDPTGGGVTTPPDDPVVDGPLIDALKGNPWLPQGEIQALLLDGTPLSQAVLAEVVTAPFDVIAHSVQMNVFMANMPLPAPVYEAIMGGQSQLSSTQLVTIAAAQAAAAGGTTAP